MTSMTISFATRLAGHSLAALTLTLTLAASQSPQLRIYQIDVEQADAALIVSPNMNTLVIDTGLGNGRAQRIKALMDKLGITKIDHLVTSHYHDDHYGGVPGFVTSQSVNVVKAYDRGAKDHFKSEKTNSPAYQAYQTSLGHRATALKPGDTIDVDPTMTVTCIASSGAAIGEQNPSLVSEF